MLSQQRVPSVFGHWAKRNSTTLRCWAASLLAGLLVMPMHASAATVTAENLGRLPGSSLIAAEGVSADGSTLVGFATTNIGYRAWRWTQAGGWQDLGLLPGDDAAVATAVSADGSVVVGYGTTPAGFGRAWRWTQAGGMQDLGLLPGDVGTGAFAVSADGSVVAGECHLSWRIRACRWTQAGGWQLLNELSNSSYGGSAAVSADGSVVVGVEVNLGVRHAWRWTQAGGLQDLGLLPGADGAVATAVSADGSVVVGYGTTPAGFRAWRWTQASGMQDLGVLAGGGSYLVKDVSADGSVVVGVDVTSTTSFRWTAETGMQQLDALPGGIAAAYATNSDGSVVVGYGRSPSQAAYVIRWTIANNGTAVTPAGQNVPVQTNAVLPDGSTSPVSVTFASVAAGGVTTVTTKATGAPPPTGFKLGQPPIYYDVSTTATFTGSALVCLSWAEGQFHNEGALKLWHFENNVWRDVTQSVNTSTNTICGQVTSLSPFIITEKAYTFAGFFQPVDNLPAVNGVKAGSAVPLKFSLGGYQGLNIFDAGSPRLQAVACQSTPAGDIEQTVASSTSGLSYDTSSGQYTFVWKTSKSHAGLCLEVVMDFNDGSSRRASFRFKP